MRPGRISWALMVPLVAAGLLGCAAPGTTGMPPVCAVRPIASPSPADGRYPDGLPRLFDAQPVFCGVAALDHERAATDATPFFLGGWVTLIPGIFYSCPAETAPADLWLAPCGQPAFSDVAGDTNGDLVAQGELTFHVGDDESERVVTKASEIGVGSPSLRLARPEEKQTPPGGPATPEPVRPPTPPGPEEYPLSHDVQFKVSLNTKLDDDGRRHAVYMLLSELANAVDEGDASHAQLAVSVVVPEQKAAGLTRRAKDADGTASSTPLD